MRTDKKKRSAYMRVIHCPENIAGQAWAYARAVEEFGADAKVVTYNRHPFGFPDDLCLNINAENRRLVRRARMLAFFLEVIRDYDIVHYHFAATLLPRYMDLRILRALGIPTVMNFWGSDVRKGIDATRSNPYFHLIGDYERDDVFTTTRLVEIAKYVDVAIVPDFELQAYVAGFFRQTHVVPNCVSTEEFLPAYPEPNNDMPLVVHCPSARNIKGTHYILEAVNSIRNNLCFEFILGEGKSNREVREILGKADVVIDQLLLGTYGVVATEAMALGKPVICYLREDLLEHYPLKPPIVNANPDNIAEVLRFLLEDAARRNDLGRKCRAFVENYHDAKVVGKRLLDIYAKLLRRDQIGTCI